MGRKKKRKEKEKEEYDQKKEQNKEREKRKNDDKEGVTEHSKKDDAKCVPDHSHSKHCDHSVSLAKHGICNPRRDAAEARKHVEAAVSSDFNKCAHGHSLQPFVAFLLSETFK